MSAGFPIVGGAGRAARPLAAVPKSQAATKSSFAERVDAATEAGPPPEVQAEVQAAARNADRLHELGRQLRFEHDERSGEVRIEVRDLEGNLLRLVPPGEVFDFASGRAVE